MNSSKAFTMIELIFVIVVLGILASIALPKFSETKKQSDIAKGRADVMTIRAAIANERATQVIKGVTSYIPKLSTSTAATTLFTGNGSRTLLTYGMKAGSDSGSWSITSDTVYTFKVEDSVNTFTYYPNDSGKFLCTSGEQCSNLAE